MSGITKMNDRILVAYTTAAGSTAEVADVIGQELAGQESDHGNGAVDVLRTKDVKDVSPYRAVVVGTGVRAGQVYRDTLAFLERHQAALSKIPVAYFVVCMTMKDDTEENRREVETYVDQMREKAPQVQPVDVGLFAGKMDYQTLPLLLRLLVKAMKSPEGDFRDWEAIRAWSVGLRPVLLGG
jgi:menaquinone-dependent protoporphyrinogen oxidase